MKRTLFILAGLMMAAGVAAPASSAWAGGPVQDFCSNFGSGYCMNDWNGNLNQGAAIKMYYGNSSNEQFQIKDIDPCHSPEPDEVTSNCPFVVGSGLNNELIGSLIFQLYYPPANKCIGTTSSGNAILTACNNSNGAGGGDGTILIESNGPDFPMNSIIDRYWTDQPPGNVVNYLCGTGFENPLALDISAPNYACQWDSSS